MMSTANERFREVRKACKKNQEEWGNIIGISRVGITEIEAGRRNVTDKHLVALKNSDFPINTDWIKTGTGEMFYKRTRNQELQEFLNDVNREDDNSFKKRFFTALAKLDEADWETLKKIADTLKED